MCLVTGNADTYELLSLFSYRKGFGHKKAF